MRSLNSHYKLGFPHASCLFSVPQPLGTGMYQMLDFPDLLVLHLMPSQVLKAKTVMRTLENVPGPRPLDINNLVSLCVSPSVASSCLGVGVKM